MRTGVIATRQRQSETACRGSMCRHLPLKSLNHGLSRQGMLLIVFFNVKGPLIVEFLQHKRMINSDVRGEILRSLPRSIKNKRPELFTEGMALLYDNARPQVSKELAKFKWEQPDHPPFSLYLSPCDFHVLGSLKEHPKLEHFNVDDELKDAVKNWVLSRPQEFWKQGIL
ncbi:histone-lysine N-methyltransferase SETMAR [Trichonephila inaurata madagascariensis]|uniref:Histone-lysine N-methyltransferase SETMAR n=1 Tax=Trichonephila inaurata madagascariensis TaxID=2747483 RepID=A0A8X6XLF2_9ARAC|nr:histone-lysine N-methyltransferase SETMAR [Trichonephila inaurata madagascariensis]